MIFVFMILKPLQGLGTEHWSQEFWMSTTSEYISVADSYFPGRHLEMFGHCTSTQSITVWFLYIENVTKKIECISLDELNTFSLSLLNSS